MLIYLLTIEGATPEMIYASGDSDYSSSDEDCTPQFNFKLPECTLPDFLDTPQKWSAWAFKTNTLHLWCDLMVKIERYTPLYLSDEEANTVIQSMAEDIVYTHGLTKFFPTDMCDACGVVHSVSFLKDINVVEVVEEGVYSHATCRKRCFFYGYFFKCS